MLNNLYNKLICLKFEFVFLIHHTIS